MVWLGPCLMTLLRPVRVSLLRKGSHLQHRQSADPRLSGRISRASPLAGS